jgi:transposase
MPFRRLQHGIDPYAWLADVLPRIADTRVSQLHELLPMNWRQTRQVHSEAA